MIRSPSNAVPETLGTAVIDSILDSITDIVFLKDCSGIYLDCNPSFSEFVGKTREEIVGKTDYELFSREIADFFREQDCQMLEMRKPRHNEEWVTYPDGHKRLLDTLKAPYLGADGVLLGVLGVSRDITKRKEAEQRLAWIIRGTHVGTWEWNVQTGETIFNERWAEIVGYTLRELEPISIAVWQRLTHPEDLARSEAKLKRHFLGESEYYESEARMRHKNGHWVWVLDRGQVATWSADGSPLMMMGTHQDITTRKRAESDLARLSDLQHELMHLATEFVNVPTERQDEAINASLATMGRLIQADRAFLFAYDFGAETMSNTHEWCHAGIHAEIENLQNVPNALFPEWVSAHRRGEPVHVPDVEALAPEDPLWQVLEPQGIRSLITLPLMLGETCLGYVGFDAVRDVRRWGSEEIALLRVLAELYANFQSRRTDEREMRALQAQLTDARDQAQEAARAKTLFLANMSHEIRTPLNAILGYAQIIGRECRACEVAQRMTGLTRSGEHLMVLINDLLDLARSDGQTITLAPDDFDFHQMLDDVRLMFTRRPEAQALNLEIHLSPDVPRLLYADSGKVRQVLVNLLGNAVKFTERGGVILSATVLECDMTDDLHIVVEVADTGCGIRPEDYPGIFDVFVRKEDGMRLTEGTGLGLPLSRRYARSLGGDITADENRVDGCTFRFSFLAKPAKKGFRLGGSSILRLAPGQPQFRILTVDDDAANREMMETLLRSVGFVVETATDAATALSRLVDAKQPVIDLVLMDKRMPGADGYEAVRRMRDLPVDRSTKVLIVTASGFADQRQDALAAGADGYVSKPVRLTQLLGEMARVTSFRFDCQPPPVEPACAPEVPVPLSAEQHSGLMDALRLGDIRRLRTLAAQIAIDRPTATAIRACVERYDYDGLQKLLTATEEDLV